LLFDDCHRQLGKAKNLLGYGSQQQVPQPRRAFATHDDHPGLLLLYDLENSRHRNTFNQQDFCAAQCFPLGVLLLHVGHELVEHLGSDIGDSGQRLLAGHARVVAGHVLRIMDHM
jgi:hypothetical protein